jgi:hypothetical protein
MCFQIWPKTDRQTNRQSYNRTVGPTNGKRETQTYRQSGVWEDGRTDGWIDRQTDGQMDG